LIESESNQNRFISHMTYPNARVKKWTKCSM